MLTTRAKRALTGVGILLLLGVTLYLLRNALIPVFAAIILAYFLDPVVDWFEARKVNRSFAIFLLAGIVVTILVVAGTFVTVQTQRELVDLYGAMPSYLEKLQTKVAPFVLEHTGYQIPESFELMVADFEAWIKEIDPAALKPVSNALGRLSGQTLAFVGWLLGLMIIPVFLFYFLRDWDTMKIKVVDYIPLDYRDYAIDKAQKTDEILSSFLRGQITVCIILGVMNSIGLSIVGLDLAILIGMTAGLLSIVPYMGNAVGIVVATVMALLQFGFGWQLLGVWGVFAVVQTLEGNLITPKIVGDKVGPFAGRRYLRLARGGRPFWVGGHARGRASRRRNQGIPGRSYREVPGFGLLHW